MTHPLAHHRDVPEVAERFDELDKRPSVLEVKDLGKTFAQGTQTITAIQKINFAVRRREFITVIGPSGCGKSTSFEC